MTENNGEDMEDYKYILEKYTGKCSRHTCPSCGKRQTFTRYINKENGHYLDKQVGRCNRENNCGYNYTPKEYFQDNKYGCYGNKTNSMQTQRNLISFIPNSIYKQSLQGYASNNFIKFLTSKFGESIAFNLARRYNIGTSKHWQGSTVFWQVDYTGIVRAGKIILFDHNTFKRIKEPYKQITWVHTVLKLQDYNINQCLLGEHLLKDGNMIVAVTEAEKTAVLASLYFPQYIWVSTGALRFNATKLNALKGRDVAFLPDHGDYNKWIEKAAMLKGYANVIVSDLLEINPVPAGLQKGYDIADYLLQYSPQQFSQVSLVNHIDGINSTKIAGIHSTKDKKYNESMGDIYNSFVLMNPALQILKERFDCQILTLM